MVGNFSKNSKTFLVGIVDRHPHEGIQWNELFDNQFDKYLNVKKKYTYWEILIVTCFKKI